LNFLLLKIHEASDSPEHRFSLAQNPQFFLKFPSQPSDFENTKDNFEVSVSPIYPLHFWKSVADLKAKNPIDLIVDRRESLSEEETAAFKKEAQKITQEYTNIWALKNSDDKPSFAARGSIQLYIT